MPNELQDSTALVTGATAGIGRSIALQLAARGAAVVVHGRDEARGAEVVAEIEAAGGTARFVAADLADADDVTRLAAAAGEVDILINNAGVYEFGPTTDVTIEAFDRHFAVNTRAPLQLVAALAPGMTSRGRGSIVNITTVAASSPVGGGGLYGASKASLELLTRSWADEFGGTGVRVNAVAPGPVYTQGTSGMVEAIDWLGTTTIGGRAAQPDEIADAVLFLVSPQAGYVNGTILSADGGRQALKPAA